ncbi:MAG: arylamine N-acetyltransferase [Ilumatobacter sp.]|uniref:arylamine N-acetyltransferase family protein n=1 Tax=Ilumatobacter sp. TaxID=1967498 RepID=UPI00329782BA
MAGPRSALTPTEVDTYLARLGIERSEATADLAGLSRIHRTHLERIPFENLDIVFGGGVEHDRDAAIVKILADVPPPGGQQHDDPPRGAGRGGWCFELNGSLALLLEALGFDVRLLGAAVLLGGPSEIVEHLLLEVSSPDLAPHLADVGFGNSFDLPLALNTPGAQAAGSGVFELIGSPQGTTVTRHVGGVPEALLRFKRVAHSFDDFGPIARSMQTDPDKHWRSKPFATRRLTDAEVETDVEQGDAVGVRRVTLLHDRIKIERNGHLDERLVAPGEWDRALADWFVMTRPGPWPTAT